MDMEALYEMAKQKLNTRRTSRHGKIGHVAAALETAAGNIYTGVAMDLPSSIGFCAEHSAIAAMVTAGEQDIERIIAVYEDGSIMPPCGRCRELMNQVGENNYECEIGLPDRVMQLKDLLPERWDLKYL
ncbi:cytidine deaminase family protein [Salinicoccus hispanicus]|uniref:Cytidine deaminase n=1 Tax=Salinicoccus hispanicus TaxID=157225 RepID=A0A6N8TW66_9STAP|nr:cytidine deaminase [Salinicoccus hispanicus]MXQ50154.1 cytidine deaminase [Salinicoccus hispanicus]